MDEAGFFRICMIILQEFRRTIKRRRRNTSGGFPSVRSVKSCCPACAACAAATWRCGQRLHCGTARGKMVTETDCNQAGAEAIALRGFVNQFVFVCGATFGSLK